MKSLVALLLTSFTLSGCRALGLTSRVLWRVPAPDGRVVAVCQEIPMLDGPGFDIRRLCQLGDRDPCSEMTERELLLGKSLRFVAPREIELTTCSYSLVETQRTGSRRCDSDEIHRRVRVPLPIS